MTSSPGWIVTGDAVSGAWTHGEPLGTGAQPEVFIPDAPGTFYPRGEGLPDGGAGGITLRDIIVYESGNPEETKRQVYAALLEMKHG